MATPSEISAASSCFGCIPDKDGAVLYLLSVLSGVTNIDTINAGAACFACIPDKQAAMLYLLANVSGGGGGASSGVQCAAVGPSGVPTGNCGLWVNTATGGLYVYNSGTGNWDQLL